MRLALLSSRWIQKPPPAPKADAAVLPLRDRASGGGLGFGVGVFHAADLPSVANLRGTPKPTAASKPVLMAAAAAGGSSSPSGAPNKTVPAEAGFVFSPSTSAHARKSTNPFTGLAESATVTQASRSPAFTRHRFGPSMTSLGL